MKTLKNNSAFTLIELLVVIVVIGILATIAMVSFMASQSQTRDANRKSDINQYKIALAQYASKNQGYYPKYIGGANLSAVCNFMEQPNCPPDPEDVEYRYVSNASGSQYAIWIELESTGDLWISCSTGQTGSGESPPSGDNCTVGSTVDEGGETCDPDACQEGCVEAGHDSGSCVAEACSCSDGGGAPDCSETDAGDDPLVFGTTTDASGARSDSCSSPDGLSEFYCNGDTKVLKMYTCTNLGPLYACSGGRCVPGE